MCTCIHTCMHAYVHIPNMLNIPQSERIWKQQKHICKLLDNLPHEKLSLMILSRFLFPAAILALSVTFWWSFYNNNRLFMAPHLVRAQSAYKDTRIHSFHHTHRHTYARTPPSPHPHTQTTNTCITGDGSVKREISMQRKRIGFSSFPSSPSSSSSQLLSESWGGGGSLRYLAQLWSKPG